MGGRGGSPSPSALGQAQKKAAAPAADGLSPEQRTIREIYDSLNKPIFSPSGNFQGNVDFIHVSVIRDRLSALGWSREKQDAEFWKLAASRKAVFTPQANQKILKQSERDGAFTLGNESKHFLSFK